MSIGARNGFDTIAVHMGEEDPSLMKNDADNTGRRRRETERI